MNDDGRKERSDDAVIIRRGLTFVMFLIVLFGSVMLLLWRSAPTYDSRLFGDWYAVTGMIWRFHPDGRLEMIPPGPVQGPAPWRLQWWDTGGDGLFVAGQQRNTASRLINRRPAFQIIEVTDSTLRLQRTRVPPPGPEGRQLVRAAELLTRKPQEEE